MTVPSHLIAPGALPRDIAAGVDRLVEDPVERVRIQAWMALGLPVPHEQQA